MTGAERGRTRRTGAEVDRRAGGVPLVLVCFFEVHLLGVLTRVESPSQRARVPDRRGAEVAARRYHGDRAEQERGSRVERVA